MNIIEFKKGKYKISNGLELETMAEVKAFIHGLQFAQANMDITMNMLINNAAKGAKGIR